MVGKTGEIHIVHKVKFQSLRREFRVQRFRRATPNSELRTQNCLILKPDPVLHLHLFVFFYWHIEADEVGAQLFIRVSV